IARLDALEELPDVLEAYLAKSIAAGAVAHEAALKDEGPTGVRCRNLVARCQRQDFVATLEEPRKGTHDERARAALRKSRKRRLKIERAANADHNDLTPERLRGLEYLPRLLLE